MGLSAAARTVCITRIPHQDSKGTQVLNAEGAPFLVEPPKHHNDLFEWCFDRLHHGGGEWIAVWRSRTHVSESDTCAGCGKLLGPPYGEGFTLVCTCGQRFSSYTDVEHRLFRWRAVETDGK
jgi:hypothetical protein